jgi:translation initiation factor IF-2
MSGIDKKDPEGSKKLSKVDKGQVRQTFSHGRSKTVEVERRRSSEKSRAKPASSKLTSKELESRMKALQNALAQKESEKPTSSPTGGPSHSFEIKPLVKSGLIKAPPSHYEKIEKEIKKAREEELVREKEARKEARKETQKIIKKEEASSSQKQEDGKRPFPRRRLDTPKDNRYRRNEEGPKGEVAKKDGPREYPRRDNPSFDRKKEPGSDARPFVKRTGEDRRPFVRKDPSTPFKSSDKKPEDRRTGVDAPVFVAEEVTKNSRKRPPVKKITQIPAKNETKKNQPPRDQETRLTKRVIDRVLDTGDLALKQRSYASLKRAREKQKHQNKEDQDNTKVIREVVIPDTIIVGELANRMAVRAADVVKTLMNAGMMVTVNQAIDADTAELICAEFGHKTKRISDNLLEEQLITKDSEETLVLRAPIVTIMGHVDHGKTSLLDALRQSDVASGEAGGITQHIGAYQVTLPSKQKITFIDTPGHAAFTQMRARGANVTDIVVLVVAADDGIKEQTIEAIHHAQAANVPIIVAINKIDKPDADSHKVRADLLSHNVVIEEFGGEIIAVDVSAKQKLYLDKLEEAILLQAEISHLRANPNRSAAGMVVESRIDKGRGVIATVLIQNGTLSMGDAFVAGSQWGRVKAMHDDHGKKLLHILPSTPVELLGFNGTPVAGDTFFVVENEQKAREIAEFREEKEKEKRNVASSRTSLEKMMDRISAGDVKELAVVVKADVHGSLEAIISSMTKMKHDEVSIRVLHGGVGSINESDVILARASSAIVIGFNVRANTQARELARRDSVDIRYYSIIYDIIDDMKGMLAGLLAPTLREKALGMAEIRQIFVGSKIGKVAGCYVTEGLLKRNARLRILRDNIVIHEGDLKTLKRFKEDAKEVKENYECGVVLDYPDIKEGDILECFEMEEIKREL